METCARQLSGKAREARAALDGKMSLLTMAEPAARRSEIYRLIALGSDLDVAAHREVLERDGAVVQIVDRTRVLWTTIRDAGAWMGEQAPAYVLAMGTEERMRHSLDAAIWEVSCACRPEWERLNDELLELCEMGEGPSALALLHGPLACAVNVPSRLYGGTALSCAAAMGHAALVHRLLSLGASATLRAPARGPLHCAWLPLACATVHAQHAREGPPYTRVDHHTHLGHSHRRYLETIQLLVAGGASPEAEEQELLPLASAFEDRHATVSGATPLAIAFADAARPPAQQRMGEVLTLFKQARRSRLWGRLRRVAPLVGRWRRALLLLFEEVHYRPCHEGAKRCRASFEAMAEEEAAKRAAPA